MMGGCCYCPGPFAVSERARTRPIQVAHNVGHVPAVQGVSKRRLCAGTARSALALVASPQSNARVSPGMCRGSLYGSEIRLAPLVSSITAI